MSTMWYRTCVCALALIAALALSYQSHRLDKPLGHSFAVRSLAKHQPARIDAPLARSASAATPFSAPLTFEPTSARERHGVQFIGRGKGLAVALTRDGIELATRQGPGRGSAVASLRFARGRLVWSGSGKVRAETNYFIGNDPREWRTHVPHFMRAETRGDGMDVVVYGNEEGLEYDLNVRPGADVSRIRLAITGATNLHVDAKGDIAMRVGASEFRMKKPAIFEELSAENERQRTQRTAKEDTEKKATARRIDGGYELETDGTIGFRVVGRNPKAALVIDPSISVAYSSFLGGAGSDTANSVAAAADSTGKIYIYIGGTTTSPTTFPETPTAQLGPGIGSGSVGAAEFFIAKIDPAQTGANSLVYLTFLGGSTSQAGGLIAVDTKGDVAITGTTTSSDFPVAPSTDTSTRTSGSNDTTVSEIDPTGSKLMYSTMFGGSGAESGQGAGGIALDKSGNIFVASDTNSTDLPVTTGSYVQTYQSPTTDGFLAVFEPSGTLYLKYCTYLGLDGQIGVGGVAVDASGNAYIAGFTSDPNADFPVTNSLQPTYGGGAFDAFLIKISPVGNGVSDLIYATLLGGSGSDQAFAVAMDSATPPNAYVTGTTASTNFPTNGTVAAYQTSLPSNATSQTSDAFLTVVAQSAIGVPSLAYSTYLGGSQADTGQSIAVVGPYAVYITGTANSWNFPWHDNLQPFNGYGDAFVAELDTTSGGAASLIYSTPLGGTSPPGANASARGSAIAIDPTGNVWAVGETTSADFPSAGNASNGFQPICASCQESPAQTDAFVVEIHENATQQLPSVYFSAPRLNFGSQPLGTQNIPPQFAAVKNGGEAPLHITSLAISGANSQDFGLSSGAGCTSSPIPPGGMCSFEATFVPSVVGPEGAVVRLVDDAPGVPQVLELVGIGQGALGVPSPASLNFGSVPEGGTSGALAVLLENAGNEVLHVSGAVLGGSDSGQFVLGGGPNSCSGGAVTVSPGASCTITVEFEPSNIGSFPAEIDVTDDSGGVAPTIQKIPLVGVGAQGEPLVTLFPASLQFGVVSVGSTAVAQTVTLTNSGSIAMNLANISIVGPNAADFVLVNAGTRSCLQVGTLGVGTAAACTIGVQFSPKSAGSKSATLSFADDAPGSPQSVALAGFADAPAIGIVPASLTFGGQSVATRSAAQQITITNSGSGPLAINGITVAGANVGDFGQSNNCPPSLGTSATCTVSVTFQPTATGARSASISVSDDAPNSPQAVPATGTGTQAAMTFTPTGAINFGNQAAGTASTPVSVTVTNSGTGALTISKLSFTDANAGDFSETDNCSGSIAPGATCTVQVTFQPQCGNIPAARTAALNAADNAIGSPQSVALSGAATGSICFVVPAGGATTATVSAGQMATYSLGVSAANEYAGTVALAYSGCPPVATCTVTPTNPSVGGGTLAKFNVSVGTTAGTSAMILRAPPSEITAKARLRDAHIVLLVLTWVAGLASIVAMRRWSGVVSRFAAMAAFALALGLGIAACGGGTYNTGGGADPGTPVGTYTIGIIGTANGSAQQFSVTLTVD